MSPTTRDSTSPRPDFAALFLVRECNCAREDCEICQSWQLTPRTADLLHMALEIMADQAFDDIEEHGSEPVEREDGGDWLLFERLPRITWNQDANWRRHVARACDDLAGDLACGDWPLPQNVGGSIVLHLAIEDGPDCLEEKEDAGDEEHDALPRHGDDYDWARLSLRSCSRTTMS